MRRAHVRIGHGHTAAVAQGVGEPCGERGEPRRHGLAAPLRQQLHADRRHLERDEMVALAHVEAARAGHEGGVAIVDLPLRRDGAAAIGGLLQGHATLMPLRDVEECAAVGPEQPLIGGKHQEVGIEALNVGRHDADRVGRVDEQRRPCPAQRRRHPRHVDCAAVGPVHRGDRGECQRRAWARDRGEHRRSPVAVVGSRHALDSEAAGSCARGPLEHGGGMVVLQHQHAGARGHRERLGGGGDAVAHRRHQRHVLGIGIDQPRGGAACALILRGRKFRIDPPGLALADDADAPCLLHGERERTPGGGVEVTDVAGYRTARVATAAFWAFPRDDWEKLSRAGAAEDCSATQNSPFGNPRLFGWIGAPYHRCRRSSASSPVGAVPRDQRSVRSRIRVIRPRDSTRHQENRHDQDHHRACRNLHAGDRRRLARARPIFASADAISERPEWWHL